MFVSQISILSSSYRHQKFMKVDSADSAFTLV